MMKNIFFKKQNSDNHAINYVSSAFNFLLSYLVEFKNNINKQNDWYHNSMIKLVLNYVLQTFY